MILFGAHLLVGISSPNYNAYVRERVYCRDLSVSCCASFDPFVTSPMRGDVHQPDYCNNYFMFLGLQVLHHDLQSIFLKDNVGMYSDG